MSDNGKISMDDTRRFGELNNFFIDKNWEISQCLIAVTIWYADQVFPENTPSEEIKTQLEVFEQSVIKLREQFREVMNQRDKFQEDLK